MDNEDLEKIVNNSNHIPGIYNYCDRWCERCLYVPRCSNFSLHEKLIGDWESQSIDNKAFWQKMCDIFQLTIEMVKKEAERMGVDLDSVNVDQEEGFHKSGNQELEKIRCTEEAMLYGKMASEWFDSAEDLFQEKENELKGQAVANIPGLSPHEEAGDLQEATEVIHWYQHQIYIKLKRASDHEPELDDLEDSNGSAKVALIGCDRSLAAWGMMHKLFPNQSDKILDILVHLSRLRNEIEREFPKARDFKRPGLD